MSGAVPASWTRRGEWLEAMPGKPVAGASEPALAAEDWLRNAAKVPEKLLARLLREGGVQWRGDRLRVAFFPPREPGLAPDWCGLDVLYEDDFCLVALKPAGMNVHPDGSGREEPTLDGAVAGHYAMTGQACAVRHIHRLDKDTSGPVLYAKNELAQLVLDEAMAAKMISRRYAALVYGEVPDTLQVIDEPIGRDRHHSGRRRVSPSGQNAVTRITGLEKYRGASLVRLELETGRTHQIRVHFSHLGFPLIGDLLYGGGPVPGRPRAGAAVKRQALHGESLVFPHPWTREKTEVVCPWPEDLERLRRDLEAGGPPAGR